MVSLSYVLRLCIRPSDRIHDGRVRSRGLLLVSAWYGKRVSCRVLRDFQFSDSKLQTILWSQPTYLNAAWWVSFALLLNFVSLPSFLRHRQRGRNFASFKLIAWNMRGTTWNVTRAKMAAHTQSALALLSFLHTAALFLANQWFLNVTVAYKGYPTLLIGSITLQLASRITWLRLVATYLIKYAEGTPWQLWMGLQRGRWHGTLFWVNNLFLCSQSGFWKLTSCIYCS